MQYIPYLLLQWSCATLVTVACSSKSGGQHEAAPAAPPVTTPNAQNDQTVGALSFARDIAPILATNCGGCHSAGGTSPLIVSGDAQTDAKTFAAKGARWLKLVQKTDDSRMPPPEDRQAMSADEQTILANFLSNPS